MLDLSAYLAGQTKRVLHHIMQARAALDATESYVRDGLPVNLADHFTALIQAIERRDTLLRVIDMEKDQDGKEDNQSSNGENRQNQG